MAYTVGLYKIVVHFEAFVHESIILLLPPPTCSFQTTALTIARLWRHIRLPHDPSYVCHNTIQYWQRQSRVKAKYTVRVL